jgi:hypothetical protein
LLADLYSLPANWDVAVLCTNLRELNGKRPVFADHIESDFLFPLLHLRFIEMAPGSIEGSGEVRSDGRPVRRDERIAASDGASSDDGAGADEHPRLPAGAPVATSTAGGTPDAESDLDIDEDFLRRVRDA